ncbi:MAG: helix-turn-helix domain-containing protein [Nocardioidaceae bacterium]|mgnify:CR=1 FL=1
MSDPGDPRVLRAIAHPVRNRILLEIEAAGPMRAADIAQALGVPANQASFHLRQLAKYGVVEEAPDQARDRRDRVWRLSSGEQLRLDVSGIESSPGGKAAVSVWARQAEARAHQVVQSAFTLRHAEGTSAVIVEGSVRLSRDEARQFGSELDELVEAWMARTRGADDGVERETYQVLTFVQPFGQVEPS